MLWPILTLPWLVPGLVVPFLLRRRPRLEDEPPVPDASAPLVSVVVPARNEATNIAACVALLTATRYPRCELLVVDDRSVDGTPEVARAVAARSPLPVRVIDGRPLPDGWFGKPWACWQGAAQAAGELLVFTDADTRHEDELLQRAVGALQRTGADLLSVAPRQLLESFWERLVLPHVFILLWLRWPDPRAVPRIRRARDALAGGQFILVRREAYEAAGGHAAVRGQVVEDVALAQRVVATGGRLYFALAEELIETRMYRNLREIVEGWSKNLTAGARLTVPGRLRPLAPWLLGVFLLGLWVAPPLVLLAAVLPFPAGAWLRWSACTSGAGLFFWVVVRLRYRAYPLYAPLYPLGAATVVWLLARSAGRSDRIRWKGRVYDGKAGTTPGGEDELRSIALEP